MSDVLTGSDGIARCAWVGDDDEYRRYHDEEWGVPLHGDRALFEKMALEGFQAGLSWITILRKRPRFREVFAGFDPALVAAFGERDVARLMADAGIVRNRAKIISTLNNARRACELVQESGSLAKWLWSFEPAPEERPAVVDLAYWKANPTSPASVRLSKALKKRGWTYVGPTTMYALMQAMGMVNDHLEGCVCRPQIEALRRQFKRP